MSKAVDLANAVVTALNDAGLSIGFEAKRRAVPFMATDKALQTLQVSVFTNTRSAVLASRAGFIHTYKPVISLVKKLAAAEDDARLVEVDGLTDLASEIETVIQNYDWQTAVQLTFMGFDEEQDRDTYGIEPLRTAGCFALPMLLEFQGE
jgi:hypothetical protein